MAYAITSPNDAGSTVAYTLSAEQRLQVDTVTFTLTADSSGNGHSAEVLFNDQSGALISRIPDWNDVPDAAVVVFTFGRGLRPFCGIANDGGAVQNDLPLTVLGSGAFVTVRSVDSNGAVVAGDTLTDIVLYVEELDAFTPDDLTEYAPPWTAQPLDAQVDQVAIG